MANEHRQSFSSQTNCQVENKLCFFVFFSLFHARASQFIASKSQYPHLAVETKMKMRGERYKTLHCGMGPEL